MRFFKKDIENQLLYDCGQAEAEFIEMVWNWETYAVALVLNLNDALQTHSNRFKVEGDSCSVINPTFWFSLHEHNAKYCPPEEAKLLTEATLAVRPD